MTDLFGNYKSQSTRGLARIDSSKYPDTNKDFEANVRRLNDFVDYISQYLQQMQKGVDQATQDPLTNIRNYILDIGTLLGGGELLYGINLGDLQYFLPAIAAMFGFDSNQPFPLNLFYAAEHFLLGYILPLDSFAFAIEDLIDGWAVALGLSPEFITSIHAFLDGIQAITTDFLGVLTSVLDLFGIFGITGDGFGPFGELWHAVTQLLGSFDLQTLGNLVDPILTALAPWISEVAQFIDWLDTLIKAFTGGITDIQGLLNFASMFTPYIDFFTGLVFNPITAVIQWVNGVLFPHAGVLGTSTPIPAGNLTGSVPQNAIPSVSISSITNAIPILLTSPTFNTASSVAGADDWIWDSTVRHGTAGGSVYVIADGFEHELISDAIDVVPGEQIPSSMFEEHTGLVYTGTKPIQLRAIGLLKSADGSVVEVPAASAEINSFASPAGTTTWAQLLGTWTAPVGINQMCMALYVGANATAGLIRFSDGGRSKNILSGIAPIDWTFALQEWLDDFDNFFMDIWAAFGGSGPDAVHDGWNNLMVLFGITPAQAHVNITPAVLPSTNVGGIQGVQTIDDTIRTWWSQAFAAFGLTTPTAGTTLPQLSAVQQTVAQQAQDGHTLAVSNANILGFRNNAPTAVGFDDTSESNMLITDIVASTTSVYALSGGGSAVPAAVIRCEKTGPKGAVSFIVDKQASTSFYVVIYKINFATGALDFQHRSANLIASLPTSGLDWVRYSFAGTPVNAVMGDVLVVMFQSNSGSKVFGSPYTLKAHPTAKMASIGATVNPAALPAGTGNITAANWSFSTVTTFGGGTTVIPYAALEIVDVPPDYHNPDRQDFTVAGTYPYIIPIWAKFLDGVVIGGGNHGHVILGGGQAGTWAHTTLALPTVGGVAAGDTLDIVVGAGGTMTPTDGLATTIKKGATLLLSGPGSSGFTGNDSGASPGDHRYLGQNYFGAPGVWYDTNGITPGGGAGKTLNPALHGGDGSAFLTARQT